MRRLLRGTVGILAAVACVSAALAQSAAPLSHVDRLAARGAIRALYNAYAKRDLDQIMQIEHGCIEQSALLYEKQGKGPAQDVRRAFHDATQEMITSKGFAMRPLHLKEVQFRLEGNRIVVSSVVPIITSTAVVVGNPGEKKARAVKISKFVFIRTQDGKLDLVEMYLSDEP